MFKKILRMFSLVLMCLILASCGKANNKTNASVEIKQPEKQEETEPQEKELVVKSNTEIFDAVNGILSHTYDEVEDHHVYSDMKMYLARESGIVPLIIAGNEDPITQIRFMHIEKDWVFMDGIVIRTDTKKYKLDLSDIKLNRDVLGSSEEYVLEEVGFFIDREKYDMLEDIANSHKTLVRFSGKYPQDIEVTDYNKKIIKAFLSCFEEK